MLSHKSLDEYEE